MGTSEAETNSQVTCTVILQSDNVWDGCRCQIDEDIILKVEKMGFDRTSLVQSLLWEEQSKVPNIIVNFPVEMSL